MTTHLRGRVVRHSMIPGRKQMVNRRIETPRGLVGMVWEFDTAPARICWEWQVVNTTTGRIVYRDNSGYTLAEACDAAREATELCRRMWRMSIRSRDLKAGREKYLIDREDA